MPRIVDYPLTLKATSLVMHRGPMDRASGQTTAVDGTEQGYSAVGDLLGIEITLPPARGEEARRQRGLITAMQQGGNAVKINLYDPDRLTKSDLGLVDTPQTWSNGLPWSSGAGWELRAPGRRNPDGISQRHVDRVPVVFTMGSLFGAWGLGRVFPVSLRRLHGH